MSIFETYQKKKQFLICIDSDGCAMDTMDIKHFRCFGPCMIREWGLEPWEPAILKRWNEVNLYSMTRGINRFLGLVMVLEEVDQKNHIIEGIKDLRHWISHTTTLSADALRQAIAATGNPVFQKALNWSEVVNREIELLPKEELKPFAGVEEGICKAHQMADVAIVSSANAEAVREEWERYGLMDLVDICLTQNEGSKAYCIKKMLEQGYELQNVLMVGDAPGDKQAAEENGVLYYPILVKKETESWRRFVEEALPRFLEGTYREIYQQNLNQEFENNLS